MDFNEKKYDEMASNKALLDSKLVELKKFMDDKVVGLNTLREEDKESYKKASDRFDSLNKTLKETNKLHNNLKYDLEELGVKYNTTVIKYVDLQG